MLYTEQLGGDAPMTEEEAKAHFEAAVASGNPAQYAAQAGMTAACTAISGGWSAGLCALGASYLAGRIFSGCESKGGTIWCLEECTQITVFPGMGVGRAPTYRCVKSAPIKVMPLAQRKNGSKLLCTPSLMAPRCCTKTYCQLPGMPKPVVGGRPPLISRTAIQDLINMTAIDPGYYPAGTITTQVAAGWRVAVPIAAGFSGAAATHQEIRTSATRPMLGPGRPVPAVTAADFDVRTKKPWYKSWKTYAVVGGVLAAGVGGYVLLRKRKRRR